MSGSSCVLRFVHPFGLGLRRLAPSHHNLPGLTSRIDQDAKAKRMQAVKPALSRAAALSTIAVCLRLPPCVLLLTLLRNGYARSVLSYAGCTLTPWLTVVEPVSICTALSFSALGSYSEPVCLPCQVLFCIRFGLRVQGLQPAGLSAWSVLEHKAQLLSSTFDHLFVVVTRHHPAVLTH